MIGSQMEVTFRPVDCQKLLLHVKENQLRNTRGIQEEYKKDDGHILWQWLVPWLDSPEYI